MSEAVNVYTIKVDLTMMKLRGTYMTSLQISNFACRAGILLFISVLEMSLCNFLVL